MSQSLLNTLATAAGVIWVYMTLWFIVALAIKRNDVADVAWGLGFVVVSAATLITTQNTSFAALLVMSLVLIWGLRLSLHIFSRNRDKPEDYRYKVWRDSWGKWFIPRSYAQVFLLQGLLMFLIATPIFVIHTFATNDDFTLVLLGALIWVVGFGFESIGDKQLRDFIKNPKNKGRIMDQGLWQYSRHPNYFGEITQWWGIGIIALSFTHGWLGLLGPIVITFLIIKVSGVPLLENRYKDDPAYQKYKQRTSMIIPLPNKK